MRPVAIRILALALTAMLVLAAFPHAALASGGPAIAQSAPEAPPPADVPLPDPDGSGAGKEALSASQQKVDPGLLGLVEPELLPEGVSVDQQISQLQKNKQLMRDPAPDNPDTLLAYVYIQLIDGAAADRLTEYGVKVTDSAPECGLVVAEVDVAKLKELAALDCVKSIEAVTPPECCGAGSVKSQGDSALNADVARALGGIDGTGMKVGIISDGVDGIYTSIGSGDIPAGVVVLGNAQGGCEGTAMLEIVNDLAPGAELYFHDCGKNVVQFVAAVEELAASGCNIICDDIKWYNEPFFEDGYVARRIAAILASRNIVYVTSSGNTAKQHYQGLYRAGEKSYHDFSSGTDAAHQYLYVRIPRGGSVDVWLQWDDPVGRSANDYDLYLYDRQNGAGKFAAWSATSQTGTQDPLEHLSYRNNGADSDFLICVNKYRAAEARTLEVIVSTAGGASMYETNTVAADSITGHAALPEVLCCGAIGCAAPNAIQDYSGQGPVTMLSGTRTKPDICGVDGVSITGSGGFGGEQRRFYGTSASSAHIAAVAALVWQKRPQLTAAQVKSQICGSARDMGAVGYDPVFGYGKADTCLAALGEMRLPAPSSLRLTGTACSGITLGWLEAPYADGYEVWRSATAAGKYSLVATVASGKAADSGLRFNTSYYYKVRMFRRGSPDVYGEFSRTLCVKPLPSAPRMSASAGSYSSISLSWNTVAGATRYEVYRATSRSGKYRLIKITSLRSAVNTGLATGKTYYYKVKAYKQVKGRKIYGAYSTVVSAVTRIGTPTGVKAAKASSRSIRISWGKVSGRSMYEVWRASSESGKYTLVTRTTNNAYTNKGLSHKKTYWYKVRAYRSQGGKKIYGGYSKAVSAKS